MEEILVIKYGGNAISDSSSLANFAATLAKLRAKEERKIVLIHGGGPQISHWLDKTNHKSQFINGQRYTSQDALEVVEMALCANVNKAIVRALLQEQIPAVGISGEDGAILRAKPNPELGAVGNIEQVNVDLIKHLLAGDFLPVIAPVGISLDGSTALNINADYGAAHIAAALKANECLFMSNVAGILDANRQILRRVNSQMIRQMISDEVIVGGMIPKVDCALCALEQGVQMVRIMDGVNLDNLLQIGTKEIGSEIVL